MEVTFKKDEFGNYGVYCDGKFTKLVIDRLPNRKWEVFSLNALDSDDPQIVVFDTLSDCKNWCEEFYY